MINGGSADHLSQLVETLVEGGPQGLTFVELGARMGIESAKLRRILALAIERNFVIVQDERYTYRRTTTAPKAG